MDADDCLHLRQKTLKEKNKQLNLLLKLHITKRLMPDQVLTGLGSGLGFQFLPALSAEFTVCDANLHPPFHPH